MAIGRVKIHPYDNKDYYALVDGSITKFNVPKGTTKIGDYAFAYCAALNEIDIPNSVVSIGERAFWYGEFERIALPDSIREISDAAFTCCTNLTEITFPSSLEVLGEGVFDTCNNLTSVTFSGTPIQINQNAFSGKAAPGSVAKRPPITSIMVPWAEGAVAGAPWGATQATITYNYNAENTVF